MRLQVIPQLTDTVPVYYSNFVLVGYSEHEFVLNFIQAPPMLKPEQLDLLKSGKQVPLEPLAQILLPAKVGIRLIDALQAQKVKYEAHFGQVASRNKE